MKFSEQWLRGWVNPQVSRDELVARLSMAGLEVDSVTPLPASSAASWWARSSPPNNTRTPTSCACAR